MIQAIVRKGKVIGENIPAPVLSDGGVLIKVVNSCISAGTEISVISAIGRPLTKQAIEQPAKVRNALNYISLRGFNLGIDEIRSSTGQKGQWEELECSYNSLIDTTRPIELWDIAHTTECTSTTNS